MHRTAGQNHLAHPEVATLSEQVGGKSDSGEDHGPTIVVRGMPVFGFIPDDQDA